MYIPCSYMYTITSVTQHRKKPAVNWCVKDLPRATSKALAADDGDGVSRGGRPASMHAVEADRRLVLDGMDECDGKGVVAEAYADCRRTVADANGVGVRIWCEARHLLHHRARDVAGLGGGGNGAEPNVVVDVGRGCRGALPFCSRRSVVVCGTDGDIGIRASRVSGRVYNGGQWTGDGWSARGSACSDSRGPEVVNFGAKAFEVVYGVDRASEDGARGYERRTQLAQLRAARRGSLRRSVDSRIGDHQGHLVVAHLHDAADRGELIFEVEEGHRHEPLVFVDAHTVRACSFSADGRGCREPELLVGHASGRRAGTSGRRSEGVEGDARLFAEGALTGGGRDHDGHLCGGCCIDP
ncbi:hypothetical protein C8R46DRAFT_1056482 [Mycena filopes]|nr:hypothetical protein C8R46DRAFT_1056482 [Mycena filopes]